MAQFEIAHSLTKKIEGGYANDKDDKGGETYRGIARNYFPNWPGWKYVDAVKIKYQYKNQITFALDNDPDVQMLIKNFYRLEFWNNIKGDLITDQRIANEVYDNAVQMGVEQSGIYLQRTINILNRNQDPKFYTDLKIDGNIGQVTLSAMDKCIKLNGATRVLNIINGFQFKHYLELMEKNPVNEKYIGWFDRVEVIWN
jgi:lysozyme family protein